MSKHLDFTRITPDVAVWCRTEEEDLAFRQECEERGMRWMCGCKPTKHNNFIAGKGACYRMNEQNEMIAGSENASIPYSDLLVEDKPRICEILGVEVGERFEISTEADITYYINPKGRMMVKSKSNKDFASASGIFTAINHPDLIIRKPRFTEDELAMLRCFAAVGVVKMKRNSNGVLLFECGYFGGQMDPNNLLPSIRPGESVELAEVLK